MKGKFYSVGMGPGDPQLITLKAAAVIDSSPVIAVPDSRGSENVVLQIAGPLVSDKQLVYCDSPMVKDANRIRHVHHENAMTLATFLDRGQDIAYLTLGDPSIYSTANYIQDHLLTMGYDVAVIPGVPSFCAVAASLKQPLCEGDDSLHIVPATVESVDRALKIPGTKVFMKSGKSLPFIKQAIQDTGKKAQAVERCTMSNERIHLNLETLDESSSYFSIIVVKEDLV